MGNKRILIIDDDIDVRRGYHVRLKANNYDTFFAVDAIGSLREARTHKPDLIVLDLGLPGGDGFVVMERLKTNPQLAVIPIIVVSGRAGFANKTRAVEAGAKAFLEKPVDNDDLLAAIRKVLGGPVQLEKAEFLPDPKRRRVLL
jgi:DNA-binding response OmpR family regulator